MTSPKTTPTIEELLLLLREQQELTRPTTLLEYIEGCHKLVFAKFAVERDRNFTSKGSITNPRNKLCPTNLKLWPDFIQKQREVSGVLHSLFPPEQLFECRSFLTGLGDRISQTPIADEKALERFLHNSVEDPVKKILQQLTAMEQIRTIYDMGSGLFFQNHPNAISDVSEEVVYRENIFSFQTPYPRHVSNQLRPDQICVYRSDHDPQVRNMIYVCEYKAPHKLTASHLRVGLRPMNIYTEVVNRTTIPTSADPVERFRYFAEKLTAAAITQTYHYMIEGGLEYGLLTTGEAIVFLKVNWDDPSSLYYHLAEPESEVAAHPNHMHSCTAVGQYLAFTLMALGQPGQRRGHGQQERQVASRGLKKWVEDFELMLRAIPESDRRPPSTSPGFIPTTYQLIDRSPIYFRFPRRPADPDDEEITQPAKQRTPESSDDETSYQPDTPSPVETRPRSSAQGQRRSERIPAQRSSNSTSGKDAKPATRYCTQKCLLGLVRGSCLDLACPNVALHKFSTKPTHIRSMARHPINHGEWLRLLTEQLRASLDHGITPLWVTGSRGALFRVTLVAYGYTFVCKGTVRAFVKDLEHEATVYERLRSLQGVCVPVFLGTIDLGAMDKIYYYDHRVYIVHMLFLSWAGYKPECLDFPNDTKAGLLDKTLSSLRSIHQAGVAHRDVRSPNMMYSPETGGIMIIDFERSVLMQQPPRSVLGPIVPNKRKRSCDQSSKKSTSVAHRSYGGDRRYAAYMNDDMMMASSALAELNW